MMFVSVAYWIFLAVTVVTYWVLPVRYRKPWLLVASFVFYAAWSIPFVALLFGVAVLNHVGAIWIVGAKNRGRRGAFIIAANLFVLGWFKYARWTVANVDSLLHLMRVPIQMPQLPSWALPLGISFYTFESISYIVDLVRKRERIHKFADFLLFIAFFPKLVAGPILRAKEFLPQIEGAINLRAMDITIGLRQIVLGLALKVFFADGLSPMVDEAFTRELSEVTSADAWIMSIAFALQVYFDFSAYTRIALGSARLFGIELVDNFDHPFISSSPSEFWRRWHMSLSRWVRDYLFYPTAQRFARGTPESPPSDAATLVALVAAAFLSMLVFGIWHGAGWTFVLYGAYHGAVLAGYHLVTFRSRSAPSRPQGKLSSRMSRFGGWLATFALVSLGMGIFRSQNVGQALALCEHAVRPWTYPGRNLLGVFTFRVMLLLAGVLTVGIISVSRKKTSASSGAIESPLVSYGAAAGEGIGLGIVLLIIFLFKGGNRAFVYFQF